MDKLVIGLDFGTDSVRAVLVNTADGTEIVTTTSAYYRWNKKLYCDPEISQYRQHPLDYMESMTTAVCGLFAKDPTLANKVVAISADTTGSTPVAIDRSCKPLALLPEFSENPNAMFVLWKDHTAIEEAEEINNLAHRWNVDFTKYSGGIYSSEWFWAKILHVVRADDAVCAKAYSWIEHCDWIPALLTGVTEPAMIKRSRCAAGHKAMWHADFGGLPSEEFLSKLDDKLSGLRSRLYDLAATSDECAGELSPEWASKLGLPKNVKVGVGAFDAHVGAVGAGIRPNKLVKVIGTSTCDMLTVPKPRPGSQPVHGICGEVDGSIVPGLLGLEAGQSAFGDLYAWFQQLLSFGLKPLRYELTQGEMADATAEILPLLSAEAARVPLTSSDVVALDWINGRRTPGADQRLTATISGLKLSSGPAHIFKSLVESTAFGSLAIVEHLRSHGIVIDEVIAVGGISKKSKYVMQTLADVMNMPIHVVRSEQACALGAAMFAATVAGVYPSVEIAQEKMASGFESVYLPDPAKAGVYKELYARYIALGKHAEAQVQTVTDPE